MVTTTITGRYGGYDPLDWSFSNTTTYTGGAYARYHNHINLSARQQGKTDFYQRIYNSPVTQGLAPRPKTLQDFM